MTKKTITLALAAAATLLLLISFSNAAPCATCYPTTCINSGICQPGCFCMKPDTSGTGTCVPGSLK
jgi:hypothetical protein